MGYKISGNPVYKHAADNTLCRIYYCIILSTKPQNNGGVYRITPTKHHNNTCMDNYIWSESLW